MKPILIKLLWCLTGCGCITQDYKESASFKNIQHSTSEKALIYNESNNSQNKVQEEQVEAIEPLEAISKMSEHHNHATQALKDREIETISQIISIEHLPEEDDELKDFCMLTTLDEDKQKNTVSYENSITSYFPYSTLQSLVTRLKKVDNKNR